MSVENVNSIGDCNHAMQVALVTLKERCQRLQDRLITLEKENASLKLNRFQDEEKTSGDESLRMKEQIAQLERQKSQLTHHIFMVATENRQLWSRLSKLTEANRSLGSQLTQISHTLTNHSKSAGEVAVQPTVTDLSSELCSVNLREAESVGEDPKENARDSGETKEESLEEISSKLIQSFLQEKNDLEDQYAQMVEIQEKSSTNFGVPDLGFSYLDENADDAITDQVKQHCERLRQMKDQMRDQQKILKSLFTKVQKIKSGMSCQDCTMQLNEIEAERSQLEDLRLWASDCHVSYNAEIRRQLNQVAEPPSESNDLNHYGSDNPVAHNSSQDAKTEKEKPDKYCDSMERICPMCSEKFLPNVPMSIFELHVLSHFAADETDEFLSQFELVDKIH